MSYTPGPWLFDGDYVWAESIKGYVADPKTEDMTSGECVAQRVATEQIKANGYLIAAAPDLLVALENIVYEYMNGCITYQDIANAQDAIQKATGTNT